MLDKTNYKKYKIGALTGVVATCLVLFSLVSQTAGAVNISMRDTTSKGTFFGSNSMLYSESGMQNTSIDSSKGQGIESIGYVWGMLRKTLATEQSVTTEGTIHLVIGNVNAYIRSRRNIGKSSAEIKAIVRVGAKSSRVTLILKSSALYCKGGILGLENSCGFNSTEAEAALNNWVRVPRNNALYSVIKNGTTMHSLFFTDILNAFQNPHIAKTAMVKGIMTYDIRGTLARSVSAVFPKGLDENVYVATNGSYLPVMLTIGARGITEKVTFVDWNRRHVFKAPKKVVSIYQL